MIIDEVERQSLLKSMGLEPDGEHLMPQAQQVQAPQPQAPAATATVIVQQGNLPEVKTISDSWYDAQGQPVAEIVASLAQFRLDSSDYRAASDSLFQKFKAATFGVGKSPTASNYNSALHGHITTLLSRVKKARRQPVASTGHVREQIVAKRDEVAGQQALL